MLLNGHKSGWNEVRGGVPLLFTIFIDDIDEEVLFEISKFGDDTKIARSVNALNGIRSMQRTLDKLVTWAKKMGYGF